MRIALLITIILPLLISCQGKDEDKTNPIENTDSRQDENALLTSYCFYTLDDKYSTENDSLIINKWLKEKSDFILKNKSIDNIFTHNSGGPNGAEWNPSTDLYLAIVSQSNAKNSGEIHQLFINTKEYKQKILEYSPNLTWYKVERDFWENEVRAIDSLDIREMYSSDFLEDIKNGDFEPITDLNYGEILKFESVFNGDTLARFFHVTFGE